MNDLACVLFGVNFNFCGSVWVDILRDEDVATTEGFVTADSVALPHFLFRVVGDLLPLMLALFLSFGLSSSKLSIVPLPISQGWSFLRRVAERVELVEKAIDGAEES